MSSAADVVRIVRLTNIQQNKTCQFQLVVYHFIFPCEKKIGLDFDKTLKSCVKSRKISGALFWYLRSIHHWQIINNVCHFTNGVLFYKNQCSTSFCFCIRSASSILTISKDSNQQWFYGRSRQIKLSGQDLGRNSELCLFYLLRKIYRTENIVTVRPFEKFYLLNKSMIEKFQLVRPCFLSPFSCSV